MHKFEWLVHEGTVKIDLGVEPQNETNERRFKKSLNRKTEYRTEKKKINEREWKITIINEGEKKKEGKEERMIRKEKKEIMNKWMKEIIKRKMNKWMKEIIKRKKD